LLAVANVLRAVCLPTRAAIRTTAK